MRSIMLPMLPPISIAMEIFKNLDFTTLLLTSKKPRAKVKMLVRIIKNKLFLNKENAAPVLSGGLSSHKKSPISEFDMP